MSFQPREKILTGRIKGQTKPFVDENLQLQMPSFEFIQDASLSSDDEDREKAIGAWKKMKQRLLNVQLKD